MSPRDLGPGAARAILPDGERRHFQHGPIDLVLEAFGRAEERARAYEQAWARFDRLLPELVAELPLLRAPVAGGRCPLAGPVARRMWRACRPYARRFITPMAAVAGAVADEILGAMVAGRDLERAYVNDGGDIALHLSPGHGFESGIVGDLAVPRICAIAAIAAADPVRGIATSGWRGRSFSLGIADAVTVLAATGAEADAAATMIANEVVVDHPAILRQPALELDPDSDLGDHPVTVAVGALPAAAVARALAHGRAAAVRFRERGLIAAAYLRLGERQETIGPPRRRRTGAEVARSFSP